jgi:hypothetical protein
MAAVFVGSRLRVSMTIVAVLIALAVFTSLITGFTVCLILGQESNLVRPTVQMAKGTIVNPLQTFNFDDGDWSAYIVLDYADYRETKASRSCLRLSDRLFMNQLQHDMKMRYTGADVATVTSELVFVRNGKVVYSAGMVLDGRDLKGLQTRDLGWIEPNAPGINVGFLNHFKPVRSPIVVLNW